MWTQISPNYFKLAQGAPKFAQVGPKLALSWPNVSSIWPKVSTSSPILAPSWPQVGPNLARVGPKWDQVGPALVQVGSKLPPSWHEIAYALAQDFITAYIPKLHKNQWKTLIFHGSRVPCGPKLAQVSGKLAEVGRS